jgi:hypothetical protein
MTAPLAFVYEARFGFYANVCGIAAEMRYRDFVNAAGDIRIPADSRID